MQIASATAGGAPVASSPLAESELVAALNSAFGDLLTVGEDLPQAVNIHGKPSLEKPTLEPPTLSQEAMMEAFLAEYNRLVEGQVGIADNVIRRDMNEKQKLHKERLEKIQDSLEKLRKAKKSGIFGKIFGWIASIAMAIIGALLVASGIGAVAGGLLLASSALMLTNQISMETGNWMMKAIAQVFMKFGLGESAANFAGQMTLLIGIAAMSLGSGTAIMMSGAASTVNLANSLGKVFTVSHLTASAASIGKGAADITTSVVAKIGKDQHANSVELAAMVKNIMFGVESNYEFIQKLVAALNDGADTAAQILENTDKSKKAILQNQGV